MLGDAPAAVPLLAALPALPAPASCGGPPSLSFSKAEEPRLGASRTHLILLSSEGHTFVVALLELVVVLLPHRGGA